MDAPASGFGVERRNPTLTPEQIDEIAEKAATIAMTKLTTQMYTEVGKTVVNKTLWIIGVCSVAAFLWFQSHGMIKGL